MRNAITLHPTARLRTRLVPLLLLAQLVLFLLLAFHLAFAGAPFYRQTVSATEANTVVTFTIPESKNEACRVTVANDSTTKTVYVNPNGPVAVVATSLPILPGEIHFFSTTGAYGCMKTLGLICDTGDTASVRVMAFP